MKIGSRIWAVRVARREKQKKKYLKARDPDISSQLDTIPTKFGRVVDPRDVITLVKLENKLFIMVTLVSGKILPL